MSYRYELAFQPGGPTPAFGAPGPEDYDPLGESESEGEEYEGGAPNFDVDRAVRLNRLYGKSLGWQSNLYSVRLLLGIFPFFEPSEEEFAAAVARWQRAGGLPVDGILGPQTYARLTGKSPAGGAAPSASSPGWVAQLTPLLERYRGDIPLDFLIGWVKVESGGNIKSHTSLDERGYFQIHPEESKTLRLNHQLLDVDPDYSVQSGIKLIRYYMQRVQNKLGVSPGTDLFWRMVKFQHTGIGYVQVILDAMRADGVSPTSWEAISSYVKENTAKLRRHKFFFKRDPNSLIRNVDELFDWGRKLTPRGSGGASQELEGESAAIQGGEFELNFEAEPFQGYTEFDELEGPKFSDRQPAENLFKAYESDCKGVTLLKQLTKVKPGIADTTTTKRVHELPDLYKKLAELERDLKSHAITENDYWTQRARLLRSFGYPRDYALSDLKTELARAKCEQTMKFLRETTTCGGLEVEEPEVIARQVAAHYLRTELGLTLDPRKINSRGFGRTSWCDVLYPNGVTIRVSFVKVPHILTAVQVAPKLGPKREYGYNCAGKFGRSVTLGPPPQIY